MRFRNEKLSLMYSYHDYLVRVVNGSPGSRQLRKMLNEDTYPTMVYYVDGNRVEAYLYANQGYPYVVCHCNGWGHLSPCDHALRAAKGVKEKSWSMPAIDGPDRVW